MCIYIKLNCRLCCLRDPGALNICMHSFPEGFDGFTMA